MKTILAETSRVPFAKQIEDVVHVHAGRRTSIRTCTIPLSKTCCSGALMSCSSIITWWPRPSATWTCLTRNSGRSPKPSRRTWSGTRFFSSTRPSPRPAAACSRPCTALGLDVKKRDLPALRNWFAGQRVEDHVTRCMELAGLSKNLHDQLAVRRPGTAGLGKGLSPGRTLRRRLAH